MGWKHEIEKQLQDTAKTNKERREALCQRCTITFKIEDQIYKFVEELAEAIVAVHHLDGTEEKTNDLRKEIADVKILVTQMEIYFGRALCSKAETEKLNKLEGILNDLHNSSKPATGKSLRG